MYVSGKSIFSEKKDTYEGLLRLGLIQHYRPIYIIDLSILLGIIK